MQRRPPGPRRRTAVDQPTWRAIFASYALVAALFLAMWTVSNPVAGAIAFTGFVGLAVGLRRVAELARCFHECGGFTVDLAGKARVAICRPDLDTSAC